MNRLSVWGKRCFNPFPKQRACSQATLNQSVVSMKSDLKEKCHLFCITDVIWVDNKHSNIFVHILSPIWKPNKKLAVVFSSMVGHLPSKSTWRFPSLHLSGQTRTPHALTIERDSRFPASSFFYPAFYNQRTTQQLFSPSGCEETGRAQFCAIARQTFCQHDGKKHLEVSTVAFGR